MRITSIEFAGRTNEQGLPRAMARATRTLSSNFIEIELIRPSGTTKHHVLADCEEDLLSMAECLQYHLEGDQGYEGDDGRLRQLAEFDAYLRGLKYLAD